MYKEIETNMKEVSLFDGKIKDIHDLISTIEDKLALVLSENEPSPEAVTNSRNQLHKQLDEVGARLYSLKNRINL